MSAIAKVGVGVVVLEVIILIATSRLYRKALAVYCDLQLEKVYFYGHPLNRVIGCQFFIRYRKFVDIGFCAAASALVMLALKENPTARIVRGRWRSEHGKTVYHSWVEFRFHGVWLVFDPCWLNGSPCLPRYRYHLPWSTRILSVCKHKEFWSLPVSQQFYEKLQKPETSNLLYELFVTYGWRNGSEGDSITKCVEGVQLGDDAGSKTSLGVTIYHNDWILSKRIFNEFMAKPACKQPKAHTVRKYKAKRKKIRQSYRQFLEKEYGDSFYDPCALP